MPGVVTAQMVENIFGGYTQAMSPDTGDKVRRTPESVCMVMNKAFHGHWRQLAEERIQDVRPVIPLGRHFWP